MMLCALLMLAQITKPPEFDEPAKFETSPAASTVDGSSHVAAERAVVNQELLTILRRLPGYGEGVRLIESQMPGAAQTHFEARRQALGVAVTLFLAGKAEASADLLCQLANHKPASSGLLPIMGETVGVAQVFAGRMLLAIRKLARPETAEGEYYLARALLKQEPSQVLEARRHLAKSAMLDPKSTQALLETARQATERAEAMAALEEALRRDDGLPVAHYRLAQLYRAAGQTVRSEQHLQRFEALRGK